MKMHTRLLAGALIFSTPALFGQATLVQTIDLGAWGGVPVQIVQPPPPVPFPPFSLTSVAFNPLSKTLYVADYATTNVYAIDTTTNTVTSAVYTNGLFSIADIGPNQNFPGTAPKVVLVNPATNRWLFMGQGGGAQFNGTTFAEGVNARAQQSGGAWDPLTDIIYGVDGIQFFATRNLKFLSASSPCAGANNAVAVNPLTSRVYVTCGNNVAVYDGVTLSKASVKIPTPPLARVPLNFQGTGLAVNPIANRLYVVGTTDLTSLDVLDASTLQVLASIPGLPDQSGDILVAGFSGLALPRPVALNTITNTIFVLNSIESSISVFDGKTNTLTGTIAIPVPPGAIVSKPFPPNTQLFEIKPGNTFFNSPTRTITTLGGAIAMAANEADNLLYVASVNGTVGVYALHAPAPGTGPAITQNPASVTVNAGAAATFVAAATGTPTPSVQWQVSADNGVTFANLAGATSSTLTFTAQATDNGKKYRAVFSNASGAANTTPATLTVTFAPSVTTNPASRSAPAGTAVSFIAAANGNPAPSVQWQVSADNGATFTNLAGATSATLTFTTQAADNNKQYRATFTNSAGAATTTPATLTVNSTLAVVAFNVLWGSRSFNLIGSTRNRSPWQISGIQVVFSAPITAGNINSLGGVAPTGFTGLGTTTLTWTINPISLGQFTATLAGSGPNALTANGAALANGAGVSQLLRVLLGDNNDDGIVNAADSVSVLGVLRASAYDLFADMNGDGAVDSADVQIVRRQIGNALP